MQKGMNELTAEERRERWPNFTDEEMACSCCGSLNPSHQFASLMDDVQLFRNVLGKPVPLNSGYRCPRHPIEAKKKSPGWHSVAAGDLGVQGENALEAIDFFRARGYKGFGINQKGNARYIHVDRRRTPAIWSY